MWDLFKYKKTILNIIFINYKLNCSNKKNWRDIISSIRFHICFAKNLIIPDYYPEGVGEGLNHSSYGLPYPYPEPKHISIAYF